MLQIRKIPSPVLAVVLAVLLSGCAPSSPDTAESYGTADEATSSTEEQSLAELRGIVATYAQSLKDEELDAFVDLFADDAIRFPPDAPPVVGRDDIRNAMINTFLNVDQEVTIRLEETEFSGTLAFVRGTFAVKVTTNDGNVDDRVGSWMNLMQRGAADQWLIARNMWNWDVPTT